MAWSDAAREAAAAARAAEGPQAPDYYKAGARMARTGGTGEQGLRTVHTWISDNKVSASNATHVLNGYHAEASKGPGNMRGRLG